MRTPYRASQTVLAVFRAAIIPGLCAMPAHAQTAPAKATCSVDSAPASDAEAALARDDYAKARELFLAMATGQPALSRAGLIRTMLAQNQLQEARLAADAWAKEKPATAQSQETLAEVLLRSGEIPEAYEALAAAGALDRCNARLFLTFARIERLMANFASSRSHVLLAHQLLPNDPEIYFAWMNTLPRETRLHEEQVLAKDDRLLNEQDRTRLTESLQHVQPPGKAACDLAGSVDHATIPMRPILDGPTSLKGLALDVFINGKRRRLEIDTGASGLLLSRSAAASLGLNLDEHFVSWSVGDGGGVAAGQAIAESVRVGDVEFKHCAVSALEKRSALDIDGLIGGDFFARFLLTLDFPNREVRLELLPPRPEKDPDGADTVPHNRYLAPQMKDWTKIYRAGKDLLLPVSLGDDKSRLFLVDSGSALMFISPTAARAVTRLGSDSRYQIHGISGQVNKVQTASQFDLIFARMKLPVYNMQSIDMTGISHADGVELSGFMGAPMLDLMTVHIDYRDNLIKFDYKQPD